MVRSDADPASDEYRRVTSWVIGAGGLLGSGVVRELEARDAPLLPRTTIGWRTAAAPLDLERGLAALTSTSHDWTIFWCAGAGVTDTSAAALDDEATTFRAFVSAVGALDSTTRRRGVIVFASSAGGVYGGSEHPPFTESTEPVPLGAYGRAKLASEQVLRELSSTGVRVVVARIANLYGPGQNLDKQQGLITRLCYSAVTRTPVSVFVSLDTRRDYLYVSDAARLLVECASRARQGTEHFTVKILGSGRSTTIASLIGLFRKIGGPAPRIITGTSATAWLQSRDLRLRSTVWTDLDAEAVRTTLAEGVARTMADLLAHWVQAGRVPPSRAR